MKDLSTSYLDEDFSVVSDSEEELRNVAIQVSELTRHKLCNLINCDIFSVRGEFLNKRTGRKGLLLTRWIPGWADEQVLTKRGSTYLSREDVTLSISYQSLHEKGLTDKQIEEMKEVGYFFMYQDGDRDLFLLASPKLLATLCLKLKLPCFKNGPDPIRDLKICSAIHSGASKVMLAYRMAPNGLYGKLFGVFTRSFSAEPQTVIFRFEEKLKEFSAPVLKKWVMTHSVTKVDYVFPEFEENCNGTTITPGVRLILSDVGDASYTLTNLLYVDESVTLLNSKVAKRHRGKFRIDEMFDEYRATAYTQLLDVMKEIAGLEEIKVCNPKRILIKILRTIGIESGLGTNRAQKLYDTMPDTNEKDVTTAQAVAIQALKIPGEIAKETAFDLERIEGKMGNLLNFNWYSVVLEEPA